jgi:hypothetical protein
MNKKFNKVQTIYIAFLLLSFILACGVQSTSTESQIDPTPVSATETLTPIPSGERIIEFSGYEWIVRDGGLSGPGPNLWSGRNVWLDENGDLHLKISKTNDGWYSSEVTTTQKFGFGKYQFQVIGQIDQLDPNVVLGLFNYPTPEVGPDGTNEIDIEYAHWGNADWPIGNFTLWPAQPGLEPVSKSFDVELNGTYTTHRFAWESQKIFFQSLHGHEDNNENEIASWLYQPDMPLTNIPQKAMPIHINLWLFEGKTPTDEKEVEIVIHSFVFTPLK